jgi:hypothetical protein
MKRIKKVHNTNQLMHLFCNTKNEELEGFKNTQGNVFFEDGVLWSYGHHYAMSKKYDVLRGAQITQAVLINSEKSSATTEKHKYKLRYSMTPGQILFRVPVVADPKHPENIEQLENDLTEQVEYLLSRAVNADIKSVLIAEQNIELYNSFFKTKMKTLPAEFRSDLAIISEKNRVKREERQEAKRQKDAASHALKAVEAKENLEKWMRGENVSLNWFSLRLVETDGLDLFRIKDDRVQTWRGAEVSLRDAKSFVSALIQNKIKVGDKIGPFQVENIDGDIVEIGCHKFSFVDAAKKLNIGGL